MKTMSSIFCILTLAFFISSPLISDVDAYQYPSLFRISQASRIKGRGFQSIQSPWKPISKSYLSLLAGFETNEEGIFENVDRFEAIASKTTNENYFQAMNGIKCNGFVLHMAGEDYEEDAFNNNGNFDDYNTGNGEGGGEGGDGSNWGGEGWGEEGEGDGDNGGRKNPLLSVALSGLGAGGLFNLFNGLGNEQIPLMNVMAPNSTVLDPLLLNHIAQQLGCKKEVVTTKRLNQYMNTINDYYRKNGYIGCSLRGAHMYENGTCILEVIEPIASDTPIDLVFFERKKISVENEGKRENGNKRDAEDNQSLVEELSGKDLVRNEKDSINLKRVQALTKIYNDDHDKLTNEPLMVRLVKGKTRASTICSALGISKNKVLRMDPFKLQKLQNTGPFSDLYIQPVISKQGQISKLWIAAEEEKPYRSIEPGVSISEKGVAGDLNFVDRNFLGMNQVLKFSIVTDAVKGLTKKINPNSFSIEFVDNPLKNNGNTHLRLFRDPVVKDYVREGINANFIFPLMSKMQYSFKFGADRLKSLTTDVVSETVTSIGGNLKAVTQGGIGGPSSTQTFDIQTISGINFVGDNHITCNNENIAKGRDSFRNQAEKQLTSNTVTKTKKNNINDKWPFDFYLSNLSKFQKRLSDIGSNISGTVDSLSNIDVKDFILKARNRHVSTLNGGRLFSRITFSTMFRQPLLNFKNKNNVDPNLEESVDLVSKVNLILSSSSTPTYLCSKFPIRGYEDSDFRPFQVLTGGTTEIQVPIKLGKKADKLIGFGFVDYAIGFSDHIFRENRRKYSNPLALEKDTIEGEKEGNLLLKEGANDEKISPLIENRVKKILLTKILDLTPSQKEDLEVRDYLAMGVGIRLGLFKIDMAWNAKLKPRMHFGMAEMN